MAPIIIFAFNRPQELNRLIESLKNNLEASESELYIFIDGARKDNRDDIEKVECVVRVAENISGFKNVHICQSPVNKGLATSIISGVSKIIGKYGAAIVLEDDLIVQPNFLSFMNQGLKQYQSQMSVWSVCGYTNKVTKDDYPYDGYFCSRSSSWGWATWKDRWEKVDWTFDNWEEWKKLKREFNRWGGSDCFSMLEHCKEGKNKSWAIRFCFNQFLQNKLSLFPTKSLVINDGFDGNGTNCKKYSRFKYELMNPIKYDFIFPRDIGIDNSLFRQAMRYNSLPMRIWSKIMYAVKG